MNILTITIFWIFAASIYAEFNVTTYQNLKIGVINIHAFKIENSNNKPKSISLMNMEPIADPNLADEPTIESTAGSTTPTSGTTVSSTTPTSGTTVSSTTPTSGTTVSSTTPTSGTTVSSTTPTSGTTVSTTTTNETASSSSTTTTTKSSATLRTLLTGEPPPTRSAQLGMGLGITFIGIIIIAEIIYFKRFYRGALRNDNYLA